MWKVCVDLFAGSGGFSHGWIEGGGRVAVAVDVWEEALQNHALNHPQVPILNLELVRITLAFHLQELFADRGIHLPRRQINGLQVWEAA